MVSETDGNSERIIDMPKSVSSITEKKESITRTTRSGNNTGSIRKRSNGSWEARVTVGRDPKTGKQIQKSIYGQTKKDVRQKMQQLIIDVDHGNYHEPVKMTVQEWMDEWLKVFCKNKLKQYTFTSYDVIIRTHINPHIGQVRLEALRGIDVQRMYNELMDTGMAPKTIKNIAAVMHKAFSIAIKQDLINANPCDKAEIPTAPRKEIKPLADAEIPVFLRAIQGHPMENAFALCLFAGLREGECLGLSWSQIDFDKGTITVSQQLQKEKVKGGKYFIAPFTKSNKSRTFMPPMIAFEYLKAERKRQLANQLAAGTLWDNSENLVFTNAFGRHLAIFTFYNAFKKVAASIGRPDARPHDLRHTTATVAIASGADIKSVQSLLGHATASFTLNVYAHTSERMMADTASRVQGYYDSLKCGLK